MSMGMMTRREFLERTAAVAGGVLLPPLSAAATAEAFRWDPDAKSLTVVTARLELTLVGGAIVALKDTLTGEVFSHAAGADLSLAGTGGLCRLEPGVARQQGVAALSALRKPQPSSPVTFEVLSSGEAVLTYRGLTADGAGAGSDALSADDELCLRLRLEERGELLFRMEMRLRHPDWRAEEVRLPLVQLRSPAVILGSGERFARQDAAATSRCVRVDNNICSPALAVIEGARGVVGLWPEPNDGGYDDVTVSHQSEYDEVTPQVCLAEEATDPQTVHEPGVTRSSWWRLAALPTWLDVAKRYRADFEQRSGVKPLWEQTPAWVRRIHAVCTERPGATSDSEAEAFYAQLAAQFAPQKLLLFYWNGDCILLFGDHRYMTELQYPKPAEIAALRRHGFRWMGYHPYVLAYSPLGMEQHLNDARTRGLGVPDDYAFQPDYAGPPGTAAFYDYFRPVAAGLGAPLEVSPAHWILHPGAQLVRDYLVRNLGAYCAQHEMSGCYCDILGTEECSQCLDNAPTDRRIMEGSDWRRGEVQACAALRAAHPDLALMSEVQSERTVPYTFYTWEGQTHLTHPTPVRLNHPLRAACWGSYTWTQIDGGDEVPLMAGLPSVRRADDWSMSRARLYVEQELFHDLPETWDPEALAYFRAKGGRWFQYRKMPWGAAYVELPGNDTSTSGPGDKPSSPTAADFKVHLGRLRRQSAFPLAGPARIPDWVGYREGKPFGLNPARAYEFVMAPPAAEGGLWVTALPSVAYIAAVRHAPQHAVVELGAAGGPSSGDVELCFHKRCLRVLDAGRDWQGPFDAGTTARFHTALPGALVLVWEEPAQVDAPSVGNLVGTSGHVRANGVPYRWWTPQNEIRCTELAVADTPAAVVEIGAGLHRGWCEQWVRLAGGTRPVLQFSAGVPRPPERRRRRPHALVLSVQVNGRDVWRTRMAASSAWSRQEVSLAPYAGRQVLVTLSAQEDTDDDVTPSDVHTPGRFADVRLVEGPVPPEGTPVCSAGVGRGAT